MEQQTVLIDKAIHARLKERCKNEGLIIKRLVEILIVKFLEDTGETN